MKTRYAVLRVAYLLAIILDCYFYWHIHYFEFTDTALWVSLISVTAALVLFIAGYVSITREQRAYLAAEERRHRAWMKEAHQ